MNLEIYQISSLYVPRENSYSKKRKQILCSFLVNVFEECKQLQVNLKFHPEGLFLTGTLVL